MNKMKKSVAGVIGAVIVGITANGTANYNITKESDIRELESLRKSSKWLYEKTLEQEENLESYKKEFELEREKNKELEEQIKKLKKQKEIKASNSNKKKASSNNKRFLGNFEATAYDDSPQSQGIWVGKTATGMTPAVGVIAVDPNVIPLHTKLEIRDMNNNVIYTGVAGDTGGDIKGNRIDLFKNTQSECYDFGRQQVQVYTR